MFVCLYNFYGLELGVVLMCFFIEIDMLDRGFIYLNMMWIWWVIDRGVFFRILMVMKYRLMKFLVFEI